MPLERWIALNVMAQVKQHVQNVMEHVRNHKTVRQGQSVKSGEFAVKSREGSELPRTSISLAVSFVGFLDASHQRIGSCFPSASIPEYLYLPS